MGEGTPISQLSEMSQTFLIEGRSFLVMAHSRRHEPSWPVMRARPSVDRESVDSWVGGLPRSRGVGIVKST